MPQKKRTGYVDAVSVGRMGIRRRLRSFKRPLKFLKEESGVDFSIHDLRRTFITVAESLDISVYTFKRLVNHKIGESKDVTAGYIGIDIERMRKATQKVTNEILKQAGVKKKRAKVIRLSK
jgi:integrase